MTAPVGRPPAPTARPVVCLYFDGDARAADAARIGTLVRTLAAIGDCVAVAHDPQPFAAHGVAWLAPAHAHGGDAVIALRTAAQAFPDRPLLLLHAGAHWPAHGWERLLLAQRLADAEVWSPLCADVAFDPRAADADAVDRWIWAIADRCVPPAAHWSATCSLWAAGTAAHVERRGELPVGVEARLCDFMYVGGGASGTASLPAAPAVAALQTRLAACTGAAPAYSGLDGRPVLLHVLHGWGGGAQRFVSDYVAADTRFRHLVLIARGDSGRRRYGETLTLHASPEQPALRTWPLAAPIDATALQSAEYRQILDAIRNDFGVAAVLVSSLIGHSLDALRTGLPTAVVCHDYYPLWPLLHADFGDPQRDFGDAAIDAALRADTASVFRERRADYWRRLRRDYVDALAAADVQLIAPGRSVQANLCRIAPALSARRWQRIEHGLAPWPAPVDVPVGDPARQALRVVVVGRINGAKGEHLLSAVLPQRPAGVEFVLLGCGAAGMRLFGCSGVHLRLDYQRDELPALLAALRPDVALLPSTVAETWSYTLSELRSLGVPVLATRLGSFVERIHDGVDGLLVDPDPAAVVAMLAALAADRAPLQRLRRAADAPTPAAMADAYAHAIVAADARVQQAPPALLERTRAQYDEQRAAQLDAALRHARAQLDAQAVELERRADWAAHEMRTAAERLRWVRTLQAETQAVRAELERAAARIDALILEHADMTTRYDAQEEQLREVRRQLDMREADLAKHAAELEALQQQYAEHVAALEHQRDEFERERNAILVSHSWRLTAPLRVVRRRIAAVLTRVRFQLARLRSLRHRLVRSLRSRGFGGTLARIRSEFRRPRPTLVLEMPAQTPLPDIDGIAFPHVDAPRASIIVPAYNHLDHTVTCLRALADQPQRTSFEVIVVDDCSPQDDTRNLLPQVPGLRFMRNAKNLGFIGACNAGAAEARGSYLVFLNNDTAVQPEWLDALLDTFDAFPDTGLAGAKLVYPDGRLQEAGGIVFADASGWNYGRFDDPADPRYNYVREADYCSGAAIAIPRALFEQLGGFDAHYAPAYYEDTDLAMKVRAAGRRVRYQPRSVVVHFEGVSSGTDTSTGVKAYQVVNQTKFLERWRDVLAAHAQPGTDIMIARQHRARRRVLVIDATTPEPDQDSGSVRLVNLFRVLLADGCAVTFFADNRAWVERYTRDLQQLGVEVLWHPYLNDPVGWFAEHGRRFDLVIVSRHYIASTYVDLVRTHAPQATLAFDTVDLHYLREQREAELQDRDELRRAAAVTRDKELDLIRRCDVTLVVSPVEQQLLAKEAPGARVEVLSNVHEVHGCRRPFAQRADLVFIGGFQHPPNIDAAGWFVDEILPRVRERLPDVRFHLIGSKANDAVRGFGERDGVEFHGYVPDIEPFLDGCRIAVAPLRYGAGVKGKVNMSMSYGQPVVATPIAVEGMYTQAGEDVLVAADAAAFADEIVRLYQDEALWNRLSANGLDNVRRHFGFEAARGTVRRLV